MHVNYELESIINGKHVLHCDDKRLLNMGIDAVCN